jgi:hypothetical protein
VSDYIGPAGEQITDNAQRAMTDALFRQMTSVFGSTELQLMHEQAFSGAAEDYAEGEA